MRRNLDCVHLHAGRSVCKIKRTNKVNDFVIQKACHLAGVVSSKGGVVGFIKIKAILRLFDEAFMGLRL